MLYLQRQNQCDVTILPGIGSPRLAETVLGICEVRVVRFVKHKAGRWELNERSVPSFVHATVRGRCGFPACSAAR